MGVPTFGYVGLPIFVCRYLPLAANSEFIKKNAKNFTIKKKRCDQAAPGIFRSQAGASRASPVEAEGLVADQG